MWAAERPPPDADVVAPARMVGAPGRRSRLIMGAALAVAAGVAGVALLPRLLRWNSGPVATFNAPMMVLRAAIVGRVTSIAVKTGQAVEPSTVLLTIHTEARPNPGASLLQDRAEAARDRLAAFDAAPPDASPNTDAGRARVAEQRRQRAAITDELAQLQDQIASTPTEARDRSSGAGRGSRCYPLVGSAGRNGHGQWRAAGPDAGLRPRLSHGCAHDAAARRRAGSGHPAQPATRGCNGAGVRRGLQSRPMPW